MIPKKIHYVWFSEEMPIKTQDYIAGWKRILPDYELIRWNADNFDISKYKWVEQAVANKKWAFATDYIRFWAVYNYGGIYLDADVELLRPFGNEFMELPYFLGMEKTKGIIEAAIFGAEAGTNWLKDCLNYYEQRNFVKEAAIPLPHIMLKILKQRYGLKLIQNPCNFNKNSKEIQIFPPKYFSPKNWSENCAQVYECTRTIHHCTGSWSGAKNNLARTLKNKVANFMGDNFYAKMMFNIFAKSSIKR